MPNSLSDNTSMVKAQAYECRDAQRDVVATEGARQSEKYELDRNAPLHTAKDTATLGVCLLQMLEHPNSEVRPSKLGNWWTVYDGATGVDAVGPTARDALKNLFAEVDARTVA